MNHEIPWATLVVVELRKATDTRAARWLFAIIIVIGLGMSLVTMNDNVKLAESVSAPVLPLALLLPIISVMAVTSDWTQRAAVTTFTLVPRRPRVLGARLFACVLLVLATVLVAAALGAFSSVAFHPGQLGSADWSAVGVSLWNVTALAIATALSGAAIGSLLLNTPAAIAVTLLVPITYDIVLGLNAPDVAPWISSLAFSLWLTTPNWSWAAVGDGTPGVGQAATSLILWVVVPLGIGWWRQMRREVR